MLSYNSCKDNSTYHRKKIPINTANLSTCSSVKILGSNIHLKINLRFQVKMVVAVNVLFASPHNHIKNTTNLQNNHYSEPLKWTSHI